MWSRIRSSVSPSQPVLTITHELMHGAIESTVSLGCASFRAIMFRQIAGHAATGSDMVQERA
jgi:hypothetical protein